MEYFKTRCDYCNELISGYEELNIIINNGVKKEYFCSLICLYMDYKDYCNVFFHDYIENEIKKRLDSYSEAILEEQAEELKEEYEKEIEELKERIENLEYKYNKLINIEMISDIYEEIGE